MGPASNSPEIIEKLLLSGMDIARLNLSYGTLDEHRQTVAMVRSVSQKLNLPTNCSMLLGRLGNRLRFNDVFIG